MGSSAVNERRTFSLELRPDREVDVLRRSLALVQERLPGGWTFAYEEKQRSPDRGADAVGILRGPDGAERLLLIEAKRLLNTRDVRNVLWSLEQARTIAGPADAQLMLVARYLAPATRELIREAGAAYADATGNLSLVSEHPTIFLHDVGANRDPWRGPGRPRNTLQGPPAARLVRALADFTSPGTVPELAERAGTSTGAAYRLVDFVEQEGLLARTRRGPITDVRWRPLLERWSRDYGVERSNTTVAALAPRGLDGLLEHLRAMPDDFRYAITGSLAAQRLAPYAPPRAATIYVDDLDVALPAFDLRPVEKGANVVLAAGDYDVVFERVDEDRGLRYVAPSQIAVDLLTSPGRGPSEGQELLGWMEAHERDWRR